jgi:hypothetical protein
MVVKNSLEEQGHTLIEFQLCNGARGNNFLHEGIPMAYKINCASGQLKDYTNALQGENPIEERLKFLQ